MDQIDKMELANENKSDEDQERRNENKESSNLKGDYGNVAILLFLYLLQGDLNAFCYVQL